MPAPETANGREHDDLASIQFIPGGQPLKIIVEIHVAADVKNLLHLRKPGGMMKPGSTVKERDMPHPVRVIVNHQQIHRPALTVQQSQADMMKIAGA